jgi:hypothetical protein
MNTLKTATAALLLALCSCGHAALANCRSLEGYYPPSSTGSDPNSESCKKLDEIDRETKERIAEQHKASDRQWSCIAGLHRLRIGMTEEEARPIISCVPLPKVNTDRTINGVRKQVVLYFNGLSFVAGYLYFDNGILIAIQRNR